MSLGGNARLNEAGAGLGTESKKAITSRATFFDGFYLAMMMAVATALFMCIPHSSLGVTVVTFSKNGSMTSSSNYTPTALPTNSSDVQITSSTLALTISSGTLTAESLSATNGNPYTISDASTAANNGTLNLGNSAGFTNGVSNVANDLLYVSGSTSLTISGANTGSPQGTGILGTFLASGGNFNASTVNNAITISSVLANVAGVSSVALAKTGAGSLTLSAANTFVGSFNLSAGLLNINNAAALGAAANAVTIGTGTTIDNTSAAAITTAANPITLGSGFTFTGTKNLTFAGAVTLANTTITTTTSATATAGTLTFAGAVGGTGLTKNGAGTLSLGTSANNFTGPITLNAGTLAIYGGDNLGASGVTLGGNATIQFTSSAGISTLNSPHTFANGSFTLTIDTQAFNVALGNTISGTGGGSLIKVGAGSLALSGTVSYTGTTSVNAGSLYMNTAAANTAAAGTVTVKSGALIGGTGAIGGSNVAIGGTIAAGSSTNGLGTLTTFGNVTLTDGTTAGTLQVNFSSDGSSTNLLAVTGTLDITGAALTMTNVPVTNGVPATYIVATYKTLVGGSFTTLPAGFNKASGLYSINYNYGGNNDIAVTVLPEPASMSAVGFGIVGLLVRRRPAAASVNA